MTDLMYPIPPSIEHQQGTGKLLGSDYSDFLREIFPEQFKKFKNLEIFISALRSYIVLDDYLFDNYIPDSNLSVLRQTCYEHLENARRILLDNHFESRIIDEGKNIIDQAKQQFDFLYPVKSIIRKCIFVFTPLFIIPKSNTSLYQAMSFISEYLTLLQLFDDFQDIAEDRLAPKNHNIIVSYPELIGVCNVKLQYALLPSIIHYARSQIAKWQRIATQSNTARRFIQHAGEYIEEIATNTEFESFSTDLINPNCVITGKVYSGVAQRLRLRDKALSISNNINLSQPIRMVKAELIHKSI